MNASKLSTVERLAEELVARLTIELEASGRHVHLSRADVETLFGAGYRLNRTKDLSQPGQFACAERVTLEGPRGSLKNVVILGPERPESQVEISLTDAVALGLTPPVRLSGDTEGTPGLTLRHGDRVLRLSRGLIVAKRHIHMTPEDAARFGVADRQRVRVERDALEYRRYRRTAPLGIYQKCAGLERRLREMGICVAGTGGR